MKKILLCIMCAVLSMVGCSASKNVVNQAYAAYEYQNEDGEIAEICINQNEVSFHNIDVSVIRQKKAAILQLKEGTKQEAEGKTLSDKEKTELLEECMKKVNVDELKECSLKYTSEYVEETQEVYFDMKLENESITLIYDLKHETLNFYDMEFSKKSEG